MILGTKGEGMANKENIQKLSAQESTRVIACGMIAREILDICELNQLEHISLMCLPADYHHHPEKIAPEMDKAIAQAKADGFGNIFVGYADCGTGGDLDKICKKYDVERIEGPHCFSFYLGNEAFKNSGEDYVTTFFITDFLARHFENFMLKPLKITQHPELRDMYFGNYERALYLAQVNDPHLDGRAQEFADILGLKYERIFTGYGDLVPALENTHI